MFKVGKNNWEMKCSCGADMKYVYDYGYETGDTVCFDCPECSNKIAIDIENEDIVRKN